MSLGQKKFDLSFQSIFVTIFKIYSSFICAVNSWVESKACEEQVCSHHFVNTVKSSNFGPPANFGLLFQAGLLYHQNAFYRKKKEIDNCGKTQDLHIRFRSLFVQN
jgi:hypothetical protein